MSATRPRWALAFLTALPGLCAALSSALTQSESSPFVQRRFAVAIVRDIPYDSAPVGHSGQSSKALFLDLYRPEGPAVPQLLPGFVAVHGGGLTRGDRRGANMVELCRELAARGYVCASIDYRLRGDDPPTDGVTPMARALRAAVEDAGSAVRWLRRNAPPHRVDATRIAVGGLSAGAVIALHLAYGDTTLRPPPRAVLSWSGSLYNSLHLIDAGEPPLFIVNGTADTLVDVSDARALARRARGVGLAHEVYLCNEIGHNMPLDRRPGGVSLYTRLAAFLYRHMALAALAPSADARRSLGMMRARTDTLALDCPH